MVLENKADRLIPERRQLPLGQLEGISSVESKGASSWRFQRAKDVEERALSGPRRTHDGHRVTALQAKGDTRQDRQGPTGRWVLLGEAGGFKHKHAAQRCERTLRGLARPFATRCSARELLAHLFYRILPRTRGHSTARGFPGPDWRCRPVPPGFRRRSSGGSPELLPVAAGPRELRSPSPPAERCPSVRRRWRGR